MFILLLDGSATPQASAIVIVAAPTSILDGAFMAPAFQVQVQDQFGSPFPGTYTIAVSVTAGPGTAAGGTTVNIAGGTTAIFTTLVCNSAAGNNTFTFTSAGLASAVSSAIPTTTTGPAIPPTTGPVPPGNKRRRVGAMRHL